MPTTVRPRRSVLYMPGSNARALEKGRSLPADGLILDLEDAVSPDAKRDARQEVAERAEGPRGLCLARADRAGERARHALGPCRPSAMAQGGADAILLPKVEGSDTVRRALHVLDLAGAPPELAIWCMIETPRGTLRVEEIADTERVQSLVMGTSDLTKDLHALHTPSRLPMLASLEICLLAARAARISILDGVHLDLDDDPGFAEACRQGRDLGFDGKTLIHPRQIAPANAAFGPSTTDVAWARRIIAAYDDARAAGKGVVVVDGRLVENLHVLEARRLVALAEMIDARAG